MKKSKAFTLIELIAVLVILAILALIVTPLVINIIKKARTSADKRSIDAYGRSIELAIADYLLDTGTFPTSIEQLTIEYSGDKVECNTTTLNEDSSVYLAECTVGGRTVSEYTYGKGVEEQANYTAYSVGDIIQYNGIQYYVIKDSSASESSVTLLKAEPLSVEEVNTYGVGHINNNTNGCTSGCPSHDATNEYGYGGIAYYSSETCNQSTKSGCISDYSQSDIKYVVDAWKVAQAPLATEARLLTHDEVMDNFGFEYFEEGTSSGYRKTENTPSWVYNINYSYWTMSQSNDTSFSVWFVSNGGGLGNCPIYEYRKLIRPVITISKSALD